MARMLIPRTRKFGGVTFNLAKAVPTQLAANKLASQARTIFGRKARTVKVDLGRGRASWAVYVTGNVNR